MTSLKVPVITVLLVFFCLFLFPKIFGPLPFAVNSLTTNDTDLFTVEATGEMTAIPNTAMISFGVTKTTPSVETGQNQVNSVSNKIISDMKHLGIPTGDIQTTDYEINPNYSNDQQSVTGYTVDAQMQLKITPIDKANSAIDTATKDGANNISGIQFILDNQTQKNLENQARKQAIDTAKAKAELIARDAGIHLGRIVNVQFNDYQTPRPLPLVGAVARPETAMQQSTQLNPGKNKVSATVTLSYQTY